MRSSRLLVVEDSLTVRQTLADTLAGRGRLEQAECLADARRALAGGEVDVVLLDLMLPDGSGLDLLRELRGRSEPGGGAPQVIVLSGADAVETVVEAMRLGASDFIGKPFDPARVLASVDQAVRIRALERESEQLRREVEGGAFEQIIGASDAIDEARRFSAEVAPLDMPVLIEGESGTGKELFARAIHFVSSRRAGRFVAINCAAMPESLLESELFGHVKGAFTGAGANKVGLVEQAAGGTLFLDEVSSADAALQAKLLRLLEQETYRPVGGLEDRSASCRFLAATNEDLAQAVEEGRFRADLYFRINRVKCRVPPLRERGDDVPRLARHFLATIAHKAGKRLEGFTDEALDRLRGYAWPGNVRELRNVVERAVIMSRGPRVEASALLLEPLRFRGAPAGAAAPAAVLSDPATIEIPEQGLDFEALERSLLEKALERARFNKSKAARLLGMTRASFRYRLEKFGLG